MLMRKHLSNLLLNFKVLTFSIFRSKLEFLFQSIIQFCLVSLELIQFVKATQMLAEEHFEFTSLNYKRITKMIFIICLSEIDIIESIIFLEHFSNVWLAKLFEINIDIFIVETIYKLCNNFCYPNSIFDLNRFFSISAI